MKQDGRGTLKKIAQLYAILCERYTMEDVFPHTEVIDVIKSVWGFTTTRCHKKWFRELEQGFYLTPASKHPIVPASKVTRQKSRGDVDSVFIRGDRICWSHYRLSRLSRNFASPPQPPQGSVGDWGVREEANAKLEKYMYSRHNGGSTQSPKTSIITSVTDVGQIEEKKEEEVSTRVHVSLSKKMESALYGQIRKLLKQHREGIPIG
jgi:hypothetical protein